MIHQTISNPDKKILVHKTRKIDRAMEPKQKLGELGYSHKTSSRKNKLKTLMYFTQ